MLVLATGVMAATEVGTVIHVDVTSAEKMTVESKPATLATLSAMVGGLIKDKEHTVVEIKVPANLPKASVEQIKDACRKSGITLFSMATK